MDGVYYAIVAVGLGTLWLRDLRFARSRSTRARAWNAMFDPDAEVALHVAEHVARSRGQAPSTLHLLYGLLQDEAVADAVRQAGGAASAVEDRVLTALDAAARAGAAPGAEAEAKRAIEGAVASAYYGKRKVTCAGLWGHLSGPKVEALLGRDGPSHVAVLFRLAHGGAEPDLDAPAGGEACVVLRNDDFTTMEFVCETLQTVFALPRAEAEAQMLKIHREGRAAVGRYAAPEARAKAAEARRRARAQGFPLWVGVEAPDAAGPASTPRAAGAGA
ncbi:MAG TPA: ATP-dependent Clp protease adaptor ClpS [Polyangiaceae bacterium]|nr:ATP-dependent Clp protease adaptor ClpS [Polyangiaceae bacterium]